MGEFNTHTVERRQGDDRRAQVLTMSHDRYNGRPGTRVLVAVVVSALIASVAAVVSLGWTITFDDPVTLFGLDAFVELHIPPTETIQVPAAAYVYGLLGALAYAFTFSIEKYDCPPNQLVATAIRIPAALPIAAGTYLLLGFFVDVAGTSGGKIASTIAAAAFITGLYVELAVRGFRALGERLYGASTKIERPPGLYHPGRTATGPEATASTNDPPETPEPQSDQRATDEGWLKDRTKAVEGWRGWTAVRAVLGEHTRRTLLSLYWLLLVATIVFSLGWNADLPATLPGILGIPEIQIERNVPNTDVFAPVTVPLYVYLFSLLGAVAFMLTFLYDLSSDESPASRRTRRRVYKLFHRLPAALALGAGVYLLIDSGLLVLIEDAEPFEETIAGVAFLTGLYIHLALRTLERVGYQLIKAGKLEFARIRPRVEANEGEHEGTSDDGGDDERTNGEKPVNDECVVFHNRGGGTLDLEGWSVNVEYSGDGASAGEKPEPFVFPELAIEPGETVVLWSGGREETGDDFAQYWGLDEPWGKLGVEIELRVADGRGRAVRTKSFSVGGSDVEIR